MHVNSQNPGVPTKKRGQLIFSAWANPCYPELHCMVPAEQRLPEGRPLVEQRHYLVVHAPRRWE